MKNLLILPLLFVLSLPAAAQWVTIPDANFANKLNELFPECMDGNQMDTTCSEIVSATYLDLNGVINLTGITNLSGIEYFINLEELECRFNSLATLPDLPLTLNYLDCGFNDLSSLPVLPPSLTYLDCGMNDLTFLPGLPSTINYLRCNNNNLLSLPELPNQLTQMWCQENYITELPPLPESLIKLYCMDNDLLQLPELPMNLTSLHCYQNSLTELPLLPSSLLTLSCDVNYLSYLPPLPDNLMMLACSGNLLDSLPTLPASLATLLCHINNLTYLPELPENLTRLRCHYNQINCLPSLPQSLVNNSDDYFNISNNLFTCLPNYVPAMSGTFNSGWLSYPLCFPNDVDNSYGCTTFSGIAGNVFIDGNENCEKDSSETGVTNATIKLYNENNELIATTFTYGSVDNAVYYFDVDTGNYSVSLMTDDMPFQYTCTEPGATQEVVLSEAEPSAINVNFGIECPPGFDIGVQAITPSSFPFPGQQHTLSIFAGDYISWYGLQCTNGISGSVTVNISGPVNYVEPAENALEPNVSGNIQLTYDIADFGNVDFESSFGVVLETDTTALAGDLVCVEVIVDPIDGDANPENNIYTHCYEVVNSYDPNIKQVWPHNVEPGFDGYFNYTIYFQNTGTAPAFNIRVADTLDTNLDLNTFEVTGYSHPCLTYVSGNLATFRFNNIMLPDSTSDFDGSIGYVQYRIKPIADIPVGTVIENTAHIYFDFNEAIVTNTTENEFVNTTSVANRQMQHIQVYPNPGTGMYNIILQNAPSGATTIEVFTMSGVRVAMEQLNTRQTTLNLNNQPPGMYLLRLQNELGSEVVKIVKH